MYNTTISLIGATFLIALTHAIMPNHWMPFALIGKGQKWSLTKTVFITTIAGLGHSIATTILGFIIAILGFHITKYAETFAEPLAGGILIVLGIIYVVVGRLRHGTHNHNHAKFSDKTIAISLFVMLSSSPCVAALPIFLAASAFSWGKLLLLSIILSVTTISGMLVLTILAYNGVKKINLCSIEEYEKEIIGGILIVIGIISFMVH
ncbi:MAG: hypothetical protein DCC43_09220 [Candidatus Brocadia sp.]|jgi:hypothetical protein|uniref:Urease accessory protein UreH-like transmembrane domain-containing protein n=1 Tax=Candidatus Brocadia fulgida TaxID=380242 RepID=A0A0M2USD1_9BACT|nr:MAG: hypothetical protein BROFUL_02752 [Candidatus Brocadia fulgida]MCC6325317.1 hypothetical protein [Candidatus Brocadia sp.]MCE7912844.1 hypothetical protein [Candidatus Brocadia sp. AMX3]OQY99879.1 MAG: hypothetical protein B6D35_08305 [Candidatus Brocadia sp. UTAMX2]MBV6519192.1 hypothetical protein [Candidatus Brocadia fulgida]